MISQAKPRKAKPTWQGEPPPRRSAPIVEMPNLEPVVLPIGYDLPERRRWTDPRLWLSLAISCFLTGGVFGLLILVFELAASKLKEPEFLVVWGDSDRVGLPLGVVSIEQKVYRQGDSNTVGGDNGDEPIERPEVVPPPSEQPKKSEPLPPPPVAEATPAPRPMEEDPVVPPRAVATPMSEPKGPPEEQRSLPAAQFASAAAQGVRSNLPGAPGGAQLPLGTPSQGGVAGSTAGLRILSRGALVYPREAELRRQEGRPIVFLRISPQGRIVEARIHQSCGHSILDQAALDHAQTLTFAPLPGEAMALYPVNFYFPRR